MSAPDVEFLLPGTWRYVPVADAIASKRVVARVTEQAVGRTDDRAKLRADIRSRFTVAADRARDAGGEAMWICDEIMTGVPLPASIVLYRPPLATRSAATVDERRVALHDLIGPAHAEEAEADLVSGGQPAVRRAEVISGPATDEPDAQTVETVQCSYWITQPHDRGVLLLVCSCGLPQLRDQVVDLFDLIVATLRWNEEPAVPEPASV